VTMGPLDLGALLPLIVVGAGAVLLPLLEALLTRMIRHQRTFLSRPMTRELAGTMAAFTTAGTLIVALILTLGDAAASLRAVDTGAQGAIAVDGLAQFLNAVILIGAAMTVLVSIQYLSSVRNQRGEYYALLLASVLGMLLLTSAVDLLMLFLAVEVMSIPIYVLAGYQRSSLRSNESALKYFIIGSFASAVLLYGCSLLFGATGSIQLRDIGAAFNPEEPVALVGAGLVLVGLAFKVGSVPFHQWVPDVYEGAPTTISAFMATTVKAAAFGALVRLMSVAFDANQGLFYVPLFWLAVASMTVGNLMAIVQSNTKRMLAYSSIAHAGYLLVGVCVGTAQGYAAVLFYLLVYTFMTLAAFTVVAVVAGDRGNDQIDDLAGLHGSRPFLAGVMALAMFSLAGIPLTGGFVAKFQLFSAAVERGNAIGDTSLIWLAILGVLNSAISLAYYLRIPVVMYMRDPRVDLPARSGAFGALVLGACAVAMILLGLAPENLGVAFGDVNALATAAEAALALLR
jgi:NADH-quinone oxidoreductase subunit N